ncbi:MAG: hemolysin family protein [Natronomonas sp.]
MSSLQAVAVDPTTTLLGIAAIVFLTGISAFFSSSELAVFSVASHRVDALLAAETPGAAALSKLRDNPHRFLVTALVSNNVANIAAASVATAVLVQVLSPTQAATGATVFTSLFVIVFGEIAPKSYAVSHAERHALRVARPVVVIQRFIRPVLFIFEVLTAAVNRVTGGDSEFETYLTREDIETIVLSGEEVGAIDTGESAMIRSVLELGETTVRTVMISRVNMTAVAASSTLDELVDAAVDGSVLRIPVYGENRDDIRGIVDLRDALEARREGRSLDSVLREPQVVPDTKPIDELLTEMQAGSYRMVVVVDEFGAVDGVATLEDILEEVVGEILDRDERDPVTVIDETTAVAQGWTTVAYLNDALGLSLPVDGEFETVAGLIQATAGRLPAEGEDIEIGTVRFTIVDATRTRLRRVRIEHDGVSPESGKE